MNVFVRILQLCSNVFSLIFFPNGRFMTGHFFISRFPLIWNWMWRAVCFFLRIKKNHCRHLLNDGLYHAWTARTEHLRYICICMHSNMKHTSFQMFLFPLMYFFFFFTTLLCLLSLLLLSEISLSPCFYLSDQTTHLSFLLFLFHRLCAYSQSQNKKKKKKKS